MTNMSYVRWMIAAGLGAVLAGCATPPPEILSKTETFAPTEHVEVLLDTPTQPHKTFAILEDYYGKSPEETNARLSAVAQEIGADAIVIIAIDDKTVIDWVAAGGYYSTRGYYYHPHYRPIKYTYRSVRAKAIKYVDTP
jgi:hypothetical protein